VLWFFFYALGLDSSGVASELHFGSDMVCHLGYFYVMCDNTDDYSKLQE
jgi:hypothetical protein